MVVTGFVAVIAKIASRVDRFVSPNEVIDHRAVRAPILQEMVSVIWVVSTTVFPGILASFGGGSFVFGQMVQPVAQDCRVAELPGLAMQGFGGFACRDGFIAVDMQISVEAWQDLPEEDRGLGFVAPIFQSRAAAATGAAPVAWAAKAGSRVRDSWCDSGYGFGGGGTCGLFAEKLEGSWSGFIAPKLNFGQAWGFNITHFPIRTMLNASTKLRQAHAWPANMAVGGVETFVVAENFVEYFGQANAWLYVTLTLLAVGCLDRLYIYTDSRVWEQKEDSRANYEGMIVQTVDHHAPSDAGLFDQVSGFWNDPLSTKKIESLSERLRAAPRGVPTYTELATRVP